MKRIAFALALLGLVTLGGQSFAELCTIDAVPAATLLLPYFEVDLGPDAAVTTLFSVNNASAAPTVAHVTLWTDFTIPTLDFDIFLTGYDVQTVNLRDLFQNGDVPVTADQARDPFDDISPGGFDGDFDSWDGSIPGCGGILPIPGGNIGGALLQRIQQAHTGSPVTFDGGLCLGWDHGDEIARGYITIDNVNECNLLFPSSPGYFAAGGTGTASDVNQLWGDYFYVDLSADGNFAQGEPLVHIEAEPNAFVAGDYTYYGRYVAFSAVDDREPLVTAWGTRYFNDPDGALNGGTDLIIWRDSRDAATGGVFCGGGPGWFQLNQSEIIAFDEEENWTELCLATGSVSPPPGILTCIPLETQRISLLNETGPGAPLNVPYEFGWMYLNLNLTSDPIGVPNSNFPAAQSWLVAVHSADGAFSVGYSGVQLASTCEGFNTPLWDLFP